MIIAANTIFFTELAFWAVGATRSNIAFRLGHAQQTYRIAIGLGLAGVCTTTTGLATSATLYRLHFATWYAVLLVLVVGGLYPLLSGVVAGPLTARLRGVLP